MSQLNSAEGQIAFGTTETVNHPDYYDEEVIRINATITSNEGKAIEVHLINPGVFVVTCGVGATDPKDGDVGIFFIADDGEVVHYQPERTNRSLLQHPFQPIVLEPERLGAS